MVKGAVFLRTTALTLALLCAGASMAIADVLHIKADAPTVYVVKKGDTLWDISNIFLDKPWLWPELWRNNTQIVNPHLIYPGDALQLRYENGRPVIDIVRDIEPNKNTMVLTPQSAVINKRNPISVLPWSSISPFIRNDSMIDVRQYHRLPTLLGDNLGTPRFIEQDYVLTHNLPNTDAAYQVVRKVREVFDSEGNSLGLQINHVSDAAVSNLLSDDRQVVHLSVNTFEAKQGDKLIPKSEFKEQDLTLVPAGKQVGELVENINGNSLISVQDIVIVNLGEDEVAPGTVFGIYHKGPDIMSRDKPAYTTNDSVFDIFSRGERVEQPAFKVGELVVIKSFANASYAWVTKTETHLMGGELIAKP